MAKRLNKLPFQTIAKWVGKFLIAGGLYFLFGKIGSLIPLQPAFFSIFWIPSGFALTAIIIFKKPAIFGVLLSSFVLHLNSFSTHNTVVFAGVLSLLLTGQAIISARLINKNVKLIPPDNVKDTVSVISILVFFSLLAAIIGTLILKFFMIELPIPVWLFASIWLTGNIISNFTIIPILMPIYHRLRVHDKRAQFVGVFSFLIISFTFLLVYITWVSETDRINSTFEEDSSEMFSIIKTEFLKEIESIQGIKALFNASDRVERDEFSNFAKIYLENSDSTISLSWIPIVRSQQLDNFENGVKEEGFRNYKVFELDSTFQKIDVSERNEYFPVNFYVSNNNSENEMGFDFGSNPSLRDAIIKASDRGKPIITNPINLHLSPSDIEDIYVIVPIYGKSAQDTSIKENKGNIIGFGVGNFDIDNTIRTALTKIKNYDITTYLFDVTDSSNPIFISHYPHTSLNDESNNANDFYQQTINKHNTYEQKIEIFGRSWMLISVSGTNYSFKIFPNYSIMVLVIGITLLIAYLINSKNREVSEKKIRKSESMFRSLSDSALTGIVRFKENGSIQYANDALARIFGFQYAEDFCKTNLIDHFEEPEEIKAIIESSIKGISLVNKQFKVKDLSNKSRDILVSAGFFEGLISANIVDITNVNQLNKEVQQLNHAIRQMSDTVFITDCNGIIEFVNPSFEMLTGFSYGDAIGKHINEVKKSIPLTDNTFFSWDDVLDGKPHEFEFQTIYDKFDAITEYISISPITNSTGNVIQFIGSGKDITDLKKAREEILDLNSSLERRVNQRTFELEKAKKEMEAFSYSVSHDLRAPLRNMHGYSSILLEDFTDSMNPAAQTYLQHIKEASEKMDSLIQDLLKLSHISNSVCVRKKVDLIDLAKGIIQNLKNEDPDRNPTFKMSDSIIIWADADLINIALNNLIRNAWKFTKNKDKAIIELGSYLDEDELVIFIKDNGAGFDMSFQNKLFGVFQRLHREEEFEGTGIGLATVKRIIDHHNGKIWAEGEVGKGATFFFTLGNQEE